MRSINRRKWQYDELLDLLNNPTAAHATVFHELKRQLQIRCKHPAFHPSALQEALSLGDHLFAFWRTSLDQQQHILCINNISPEIQVLTLPEHPIAEGSGVWRDLIERTALGKGTHYLHLHPREDYELDVESLSLKIFNQQKKHWQRERVLVETLPCYLWKQLGV